MSSFSIFNSQKKKHPKLFEMKTRKEKRSSEETKIGNWKIRKSEHLAFFFHFAPVYSRIVYARIMIGWNTTRASCDF